MRTDVSHGTGCTWGARPESTYASNVYVECGYISPGTVLVARTNSYSLSRMRVAFCYWEHMMILDHMNHDDIDDDIDIDVGIS